MKAVSLLINSALPPSMRDENRTLDKKSLDSLLAEIARRFPDRYAEVVKHISDVGRRAAFSQGETLKLADMKPVIDKDALFAQMDTELAAIEASDAHEDDKHKQKLSTWSKYATLLEKATKDAALSSGNALGGSVVSGARGNPFQLKAMLTTPSLYTDYKDQPIPLFVRRGFNEGLRPYEYLASTFGVRKGVISTKNATASSGDLAKQLVQSAAPVIVTEDDCGATNGLDFDPEDEEIDGRVLAKNYGEGLTAGTVVDKEVRRQLERKLRGGKVIVRSPMTCQSSKGICAQCLGTLANGHFAPKGYAAGITAAQAISEPLTQGALNCLVEGTLVRMADGSVKPIEKVIPGDLVLGASLKGETHPVRVSHVWDQGMQPCQRYSYRMGNTQQIIALEATEEHPLLVNKRNYGHGSEKNNAQLVKLKAGYRHADLGVVLPTNSHWNGTFERMALWLGIYLGDGIRNTGREELRFSCADPKLIEDLNQHSLGLNLHCTKRKRSHDWCIGVIKDTANQDLATGRMQPGLRNPLKAKLKTWGLLGKYAPEKRLPKEVWTWNLNSVAHLVAGYLATDGSVYQNAEGHIGVSFGSTSKALLAELKDLMAVRLCVYASEITKTGSAGEGNRKHDMWQFCVSRLDQVERLLQQIPRVPGIKGATLQAYVQNARYSRRHDEGFYRAKRIAIEPIGEKHCWDLTVENQDHLFVLANGIICSNTKHGGGGFTGEKKTFAGFDVIDQLVQSPETFPFRAAVAEEDGVVKKIEDAPQGGKLITVNNKEHYVLPGFEVNVNPGDHVEAGDSLSEGITDVYDVLRTRGLGEARRYYVDRLKQAFEESGAGKPSKLNLETIARATLDHVAISDPDGVGDFLPDDVGYYSRLAPKYSPPKDTRPVNLNQAHGKYLQAPVLHYTIGTRLTPKMTQRIAAAGINTVPVSEREPQFAPTMFRLRTASQAGKDWLAKMHTSYLTKNLSDDAARSRDTNVEHNVHFAPRLMVGENFGKNVEQTGEF